MLQHAVQPSDHAYFGPEKNCGRSPDDGDTIIATTIQTIPQRWQDRTQTIGSIEGALAVRDRWQQGDGALRWWLPKSIGVVRAIQHITEKNSQRRSG